MSNNPLDSFPEQHKKQMETLMQASYIQLSDIESVLSIPYPRPGPVKRSLPTDSLLLRLGPRADEDVFHWFMTSNFLKQAEGFSRHLYIDTTGNVTVGLGYNVFGLENYLQKQEKSDTVQKLIEAIKELKVKFYTSEKNTKPATDEDYKRAATYLVDMYHLRKNLRRFGNIDSKKYFDADKNNILVDVDEIDEVKKTKAKGILKAIRSKFPKFSEYPVGGQLALLDMAYNMGASGLYETFKKFSDWVIGNPRATNPERSLVSAYTECFPAWDVLAFNFEDKRGQTTYYYRKDVNKERNNSVGILLTLAATYLSLNQNPLNELLQPSGVR